MNFKRTPVTEASLIYGVALILGFLLFAASSGWSRAVGESQWLAFLLLLPTWALVALAAKFIRFRSKFRSFFIDVSVICIIALAALGMLLIPLATSTATLSVKKTATSIVVLLVFVYFASSLAGAVLTQFVFFRNAIVPRPGQTEFGAVPTIAKPSKKAKKK